MKSLFAKVLLVVIVAVVSVLCLEGLLRLKNASSKNYDIEMWKYALDLKTPSQNPVLGHEHIPSSSARLQNVDIRTNALGLRGAEVALPLPQKRRILFLGSSITLGWGVEEEQVMTSVVQRLFKADGNDDVVVLNAGIGNYNAERYVERFLEKLRAIEPTDIVVNYFVNDSELLEAGGGNFLLRNSQLAVTLWILKERHLSVHGRETLEEHYRAMYRPEFEGFKRMETALRRLGDYAAEHGVRVYLTLIPDVHNLKDYRLGFISPIMAGIARQDGFCFLDLISALGALTPEELWAMPGDPHPNAKGHALMGKAIYELIKRGDCHGTPFESGVAR